MKKLLHAELTYIPGYGDGEGRYVLFCTPKLDNCGSDDRDRVAHLINLFSEFVTIHTNEDEIDHRLRVSFGDE